MTANLDREKPSIIPIAMIRRSIVSFLLLHGECRVSPTRIEGALLADLLLNFQNLTSSPIQEPRAIDWEQSVRSHSTAADQGGQASRLITPA